MTNPIRTMFHALALSNAGHPIGDAYATVRDCMDTGCLELDDMLRVVVGQRSLSEALRDAADVAEDADEGFDGNSLALSMRSAADAIDAIGSACPEIVRSLGL